MDKIVFPKKFGEKKFKTELVKEGNFEGWMFVSEEVSAEEFNQLWCAVIALGWAKLGPTNLLDLLRTEIAQVTQFLILSVGVPGFVADLRRRMRIALSRRS